MEILFVVFVFFVRRRSGFFGECGRRLGVRGRIFLRKGCGLIFEEGFGGFFMWF